MITAILRAQLLSMRFGGRGTVFSIVTAVIWYGLWAGISAILGLAAATFPAAELRQWLPVAFLGVCAYWQLVPVISASMGSALDMRKLLAYPIPHGQLFVVEVLLRLTTAMEVVLVVTAGTLGLLANPEAGGLFAAPHLIPAVLLFVLFNLLLASGMRSVLQRLLSRRKVRELLAILVAMLWVLPRFLISAGLAPKSLGGFGALVRTTAFPWNAAAHGAMGFSVPAAMLSLCGWTLAAFWFGRAQFERGLRYDAAAAQATPSGPLPERTSIVERFYRFPALILPDPLAGIVEKELRSLARTPRFRMVFVMGFTFGLLVWFPVMVTRGPVRPSTEPQYFLIIVCVYALTLMGQVSYWNCFGFDRSAAAFYFAAPQPISTVLAGKNLAALFFIYLEVLILAVLTLLLRLNRSLGNVLETLLVIGICSLYMLAMGNLSSVNYPRALNPERVSQGGASSRFQGLVFLLYPAALLPVFLAYLARYALHSQIAFYAVLSLAAVLGGGLYRMATESAVHTATARREQIVQELSRGDGPVVSD
jgi:ABC-2 type transport system permease protein